MFKLALFRLVFGAALVCLTASEPEYYTHETAPGDYIKKIEIDGRTREYRIHLPTGYDGARALPLILAFHGSSASASVIERETSLDEVADSLGFVVVYPEGLHRGWNIGECCRYSFKEQVNETAFVSMLLDRLERGIALDSTRVYATGYSDGGTLAYILGCNLSRRITAVAGVSATLFEPQPTCDLSRPVSAMVVHGMADTHIPYGGQKGGPPDRPAPHFTYSAPNVARFWVQRDRCVPTPQRDSVARVMRETYACPDNAEVVFYSIHGGEHGWPGGGRGWIFSPEPPRDMSATDSIVAFFLRHRIANRDVL